MIIPHGACEGRGHCWNWKGRGRCFRRVRQERKGVTEDRQNNKISKSGITTTIQLHTITTSASRRVVNLISNLIRDGTILEHNELHLPWRV